MWARIILAALTTVAFTPPAAAAFTGTFPWARVPTMMQTGFPGRFTRSSNMTGNGRLDAAVVRFIAENYDIIVSNDLLPGKPGCLEPKHKELADRIAAINPTAKYLMYMANNIHHGSLVPPTGKQDSNYECGLDNFKLEWVATLDDGTPITDKGKYYMHNLSNPDCRAWWLNTVTNSTMGENVHGVFADNGLDGPDAVAGLSPARGEAMLVGQQLLLDAVRAAGKYVIFNGIRYATDTGSRDGIVRDDFAALDTLLPHASAGYFEPWLGEMFRESKTTGKLNASRTAHAIHKMINVSKTQPTKGITFKNGPGPCIGYIAGELGCTWPFPNHTTPPVPNGWNGTPQTDEGRREAAANLITFPLATFLCAAGPLWHFDYGWGYETEYFVPGDPVTHALAGQPYLQSNAPDNWYPDLLRAPGTPEGECTYDQETLTFSREWSGVTVTLHLGNETATLAWK